jgi:hypothetical protein
MLKEEQFAEAWRVAHSNLDEHGHITSEAAMTFDLKTGTAQQGIVSLLHIAKQDHAIHAEDNYTEAWAHYCLMHHIT